MNKHLVFHDFEDDWDKSSSEPGKFRKGRDISDSRPGSITKENFHHKINSRKTFFDGDYSESDQKFRNFQQYGKESIDLKTLSGRSNLKENHTSLKEASSESEFESSESESEFEESEVDSEKEHIEEGQDYSDMSMEQLLKLQEEMGMKSFKEKVLKVTRTEKSSDHVISSKRANKNRPSEMPLMRRRAPRMNFVQPGKNLKKIITRDPRFDDLSGNLQMDLWDERYQFLKDTRKKELEVLKKELQEEAKPHKKEKLKRTIQRMENQQRETVRRQQEKAVSSLEKKHQREALREGMKPRFMKNKDKKLLLKTIQYDELKKGNKVNKYLERKEKKLARKEKRQGLV